MGEFSITYGRGYAYSLQYHIVWSVSMNVPLLVGDIAIVVKQNILDSLKSLEITVIDVDVAPTYVHLFVNCKPQIRLSDVVKVLKGNSARKLFMLNKRIKHTYGISHLWANSYLVISHSDTYKSIIADYLHQL